MRASQRKIRRSNTTRNEDDDNYSHVVYTSPRKRSRTIQSVPRIYAPNGQRFIQHSHIPIPPGQLGLLESIPGTRASLPKSKSPNKSPNKLPHIDIDHDTPIVLSLHHRKRITQNNRWTTEVIPRLVRPYLRLRRETLNLRMEPKISETECMCIVPGQILSILVVRLYSKH